MRQDFDLFSTYSGPHAICIGSSEEKAARASSNPHDAHPMWRRVECAQDLAKLAPKASIHTLEWIWQSWTICRNSFR